MEWTVYGISWIYYIDVIIIHMVIVGDFFKFIDNILFLKSPICDYSTSV